MNISELAKKWKVSEITARGILADASPQVTDEQAAFDAWYKENKSGARLKMWEAWNARALLSAPPAAEMLPAAFKCITGGKFENGSILLQVDGVSWFALSAGLTNNILQQAAPHQEAKPVAGNTVAERLDAMADECEAGSQRQSDLYAASTIWLKHTNRKAASNNNKAIADSLAAMVVEWIDGSGRNGIDSWKAGLASILEARLDRIVPDSAASPQEQAPAEPSPKQKGELCASCHTWEDCYKEKSCNHHGYGLQSQPQQVAE